MPETCAPLRALAQLNSMTSSETAAMAISQIVINSMTALPIAPEPIAAI
jgi:hypothetical protein